MPPQASGGGIGAKRRMPRRGRGGGKGGGTRRRKARGDDADEGAIHKAHRSGRESEGMGRAVGGMREGIAWICYISGLIDL